MVIAYYNMIFGPHVLKILDGEYPFAAQSAIVHRPGECCWIVPGTMNEDNIDSFYFSEM